MKFTLSWLKEHLETEATLDQIVDAMTMAGLEVEEVIEDDETLVDETTEEVLSNLDETVIDEAVLRDLVSGIVREELQGALGERITRNVRKLVRREIHRAISAKDFN